MKIQEKVFQKSGLDKCGYWTLMHLEILYSCYENPEIKLFISTIIELEQYFHLLIKEKSNVWNELLGRLNIIVLNTTSKDAKLAAKYALQFRNDPKGAGTFSRDCFIAASAKNHDLIIVTDNLKDFNYIDKEKIMSVENAIAKLSNLR